MGLLNRLWRSELAILLAIALATAFVLLAPINALSQSCALCYTQAAASGSRMVHALRNGIIILVAPPTLGTIGVIFVCYRKRNQTRDENRNESYGNWENDD
jgi:hypothetical protein